MHLKKRRAKAHLPKRHSPAVQPAQRLPELLPKPRLSDVVSIRDISMYVWICVGVLTIFSHLQDVLELADGVRFLTSHWLMAVEWFWRTVSNALGIPFYPEPAIVATVMLCTIALAISAALAEEPAAPPPARKAKQVEYFEALKAVFSAEWSYRLGHGIVSATVAIVVFVVTIDGYVFGQAASNIASNVPLAGWLFPALASLYLPLFVMRGDFRNLALSVGAGALLGGLYSILALPSAIRSADEGLSSVAMFCVVVLHYALMMMPYKFGCLFAMAGPRHLFRRLMFTSAALGTLLLLSWVSVQQFSLKPPQQALLQPSSR